MTTAAAALSMMILDLVASVSRGIATNSMSEPARIAVASVLM